MKDVEAIAAILASAARDLDGVEASGAPGSRTWSVSSRIFARENDAGVVLALDPAVAAAAVRTPDTHPSNEGPGWIAFRPEELDRYAEDRLRAWFGLAARLAAGRRSPDAAD